MARFEYCIVHDYDLRLLALAIGLTLLPLLTGAALLRCAGRSRGRSGLWVAMSALCVGLGAWSVHFGAMLAYLPGVPVGFRGFPTLASLILAAAVSLATFLAAEKASSARRRAAAGAVLGLGLAAMHYLGMAAFQAPGRLSWRYGAVAVSLVLPVAFGALSFAVKLGRTGWDRAGKWRIPASGVLLVLGVLSLHLAGMWAVEFRFDPTVLATPTFLSRPRLAAAVAGVCSLLCGIGAVAMFQEARYRRRVLDRLKVLSASSFEGVALLARGCITDLNNTFAEQVGADRRDLAGRTFLHDLFIPDPGQAFSDDGRTEGALRAADGRSVPVEVLARRAGSADDLIIAVRDLTERRQKEQSLSLLFSRNPAPVWVNDLDGRILAVNPAALALYGYDEAAFLRLHLLDVLAPCEHEAHRRSVKGCDGYAGDRPWMHLRADGSEFWVRPFAERITYEGRDAFLFTVFDVTEKRRSQMVLQAAKEAAEAANLAKSTFLANMSHEIRTPLNGVLGMSQAMAAGELTPLQRQRLDVVLQSGQVLLQLLDDLLDVAKIEAGRMELEEVDFDLPTLLGELVAPFRIQAAGKGLVFEVAAGPAAGGRRGDPTRLRQILANFLSNAVKFTSSGGVSLEVSAEPDGRLRFSVRDTGEGIDPAVLGRLFQKFAQADASSTRRHGGTGLGLAISRELAALMGGTVEAESRLGEGSVFSLLVPLAPAAGAADEAEPAVPAPAPASPEGVRILAADDNSTNRLVLQTLLADAGVELTVVENGQEALDAWRFGDWDVLLMDIQMPVMDGPAAVRAIRAEEARLQRRRTPIVAVTANVMTHQLAEYSAAGMDGYVAKPIDLATLFEALDRALAEPEPLAA